MQHTPQSMLCGVLAYIYMVCVYHTKGIMR